MQVFVTHSPTHLSAISRLGKILTILYGPLTTLSITLNDRNGHNLNDWSLSKSQDKIKGKEEKILYL